MAKKILNQYLAPGNGMNIFPFTIVINKDKEIVFIDSGFEIECGYSSNSLVGKNINILVDNYYDENFKSVSGGFPKKFIESYGEVIYKKENGQTLISNCLETLVYDDFGNFSYRFISGIYGGSSENSKKYSKDNSEIDSANSKLDKIGHDFNNILTAINGNAQLALFKLSGEDEEEKYIKQILHGSDRLQKLMLTVFE